MKKEIVLVVGASGQVGSEVVKILKSQGHTIRKTSSKATKDAETVQVNLHTGVGIKEAFEGVARAFLLSPPGYADQYRMLSPLIQEAKRRGLKKVVLMTAMGANAVDSAPFRKAEIELEKSGLQYNIVRPNWFFQNFNTFWLSGILQQGKILLPAGQAKTSFMDVRDIAAVVAKLLIHDEFNNQAFDLSGTEAVTHDQVAAALSLSTGKRISYQEIQPEELRQGLLSAGLPADYTEFLLMIFGFLREGYNARITSSVADILGRKPITLSEYARDYRKAWL